MPQLSRCSSATSALAMKAERTNGIDEAIAPQAKPATLRRFRLDSLMSLGRTLGDLLLLLFLLHGAWFLKKGRRWGRRGEGRGRWGLGGMWVEGKVRLRTPVQEEQRFSSGPRRTMRGCYDGGPLTLRPGEPHGQGNPVKSRRKSHRHLIVERCGLFRTPAYDGLGPTLSISTSASGRQGRQTSLKS